MRFILIIGVCLSLISCSTTGSQEREERARQLNGYTFTEALYNTQDSGYYLAIHAVGESWQLLMTHINSDEVLRVIRKTGGGELFWIDPPSKRITHYYYNSQNDQFYPFKTGQVFDCTASGHHQRRIRNSPQCIRPFIKRTGLGAVLTFTSMGAGSEKVFDEVEAYKALTSANVFAQLNQLDDACDKTRRVAQNFLDNEVTVKPKIVDNSGFYQNESIYQYKKSLTLGNNCVLENTAFEVEVKITDGQYAYSSAAMTRREFSYRNKLKAINPEIVIRGKYTTKGFTNPVSGSDKNLAAKVLKVKPYKQGDTVVDVELINKSATYIEVEKISFHVGSVILTKALSPKMTLPPHAVEKHKIRINSYDAKSYLVRILTKAQAKRQKVTLGLSVLYTANSKQVSLLAKKQIPYIRAY